MTKSNDLITIIDEKLELEAEATPGPWKKRDSFWIECPECFTETDFLCVDCGDVETEENPYPTAAIQSCGLETFAGPNSDLIVAARNDYRALLEGYRELLRAPEESSRSGGEPEYAIGYNDALRVVRGIITRALGGSE